MVRRNVAPGNFAEIYSILAIVAAVTRATGYGFLLGAVFFGRATYQAGFPMAAVARGPGATPPPRS
jgi:hypothetical protein